MFYSCTAVLDNRGKEAKSKCLLKPGIHAIMSLNESRHPTTLRAENRDKIPVFEIILFYWPVNDAFEIAPQGTKGFGIRRANVSCLYLRALHEISDCVLLPVSMNEVRAFGVTEKNDDSKDDYSSDSDDSANDEIVTFDMKETTTDDVSLHGKGNKFDLLTEYDEFVKDVKRNNYNYDSKPQIVGCFSVSGATTNLCCIKFEQNGDTFKEIDDHMWFSNEQELATFLKETHKSHSIKVAQPPYYSQETLSPTEWMLMVSALKPDMEKALQDKNCAIMEKRQTKKAQIDEEIKSRCQTNIKIAKQHFNMYYFAKYVLNTFKFFWFFGLIEKLQCM